MGRTAARVLVWTWTAGAGAMAVAQSASGTSTAPTTREAAPAEPSLAAFVPADAGLFVELVRAPDLLIPLSDSEVWVALAEIAGQPARAAEADEWRRQIRDTVHMSAVEAIQTLLARRVALAGTGLGRSQDTVILCRPAINAEADDLVRSWDARPLRSIAEPPSFVLPGNIGVAVAGGILAFGDAGPSGTMFGSVTDLLAGRTEVSLDRNPSFRALLARVPPDPDGLFFARLRAPAPATQPASRPAASVGPRAPRAPASRPATRSAATSRARRAAAASAPDASPIPPLFGGSPNILLALHREASRGLLHFTAVGDGSAQAPPREGSLSNLASTLPADTLAAWAGHVDYATLLEQAARLPKKNLARVVLNMQRQVPRADRLVPTLGSASALAVGAVQPADAGAGVPPVPAVAALIVASDPPEAAHAFRALVDTAVSVCNLMALSPGVDLPRLPPVVELEIEHHPAYSLDLGALIEEYGLGATLRELHLCWTVDANVLIVASHRDWLRRILAARHDVEPTLAPVLAMTQRAISPHADTIAILRVGAMSDLARQWLEAFEQVAPQILDDAWWRARQPGGVRLGISGDQDAQRRRLVVRTVDANGPAGALLQPGDEIVGCNGRPLATTQPADEIRAAIAARESGWIDLTIERQDSTFTRRIALPFVNPIDLLRKLATLGRVIATVIYHADVPDIGPRGFVTVQLRTPTPAAPASAPVESPP